MTTHYYKIIQTGTRAYYEIYETATDRLEFRGPTHETPELAEATAKAMVQACDRTQPSEHFKEVDEAPTIYRHFNPFDYELTEEEYIEIVTNW